MLFRSKNPKVSGEFLEKIEGLALQTKLKTFNLELSDCSFQKNNLIPYLEIMLRNAISVSNLGLTLRRNEITFEQANEIVRLVKNMEWLKEIEIDMKENSVEAHQSAQLEVELASSIKLSSYNLEFAT